MNSLFVGIIVILIAIPCAFGLKKIIGNFTGGGSTCGCSGSECHCKDKKK